MDDVALELALLFLGRYDEVALVIDVVPSPWNEALTNVMPSPGFENTIRRVDQARHDHPGEIYPPEGQVFRALELTPLDTVRVVIVGQDPYPCEGQADGLAFSFLGDPDDLPTSLRRIRKELADDMGITPPRSGSLEQWARGGVLLLNTILTVQRGRPMSHLSFGWQSFTDGVLSAVAEQPYPAVFLLWGKVAQAKSPLITPPHVALSAPHPVARLANGFLGRHPFSEANRALGADRGVSWRL